MAHDDEAEADAAEGEGEPDAEQHVVLVGGVGDDGGDPTGHGEDEGDDAAMYGPPIRRAAPDRKSSGESARDVRRYHVT